MERLLKIPNYTLFGETGAFPDVVHCEHIKDRAPDHGWHIAPHRHAQMSQVFYLQAGHARAVIDGEGFDLGDDMVLYVPAQAVHSFQFAPQTQGMVHSFPLTILGSIGPASSDIAQALAHRIIACASADLIALMALLDNALSDNGPFRAQTAVALAHAVLASVARLTELAPDDPRTTPSQRLGQLDQLIGTHQGEGWTAGDYAKALGLSTGHLNRLCRAAKGVSASAYIEGSVVLEACRLLAFTQLPVAEVGYRLGFSDPSYFSRRFRSVQGETPSQYREHFVG